MGVNGIRVPKGVTILGFETTDRPSFDTWRAKSIAAFLAANRLLLVPWDSALVAEGARALETYLRRGTDHRWF